MVHIWQVYNDPSIDGRGGMRLHSIWGCNKSEVVRWIQSQPENTNKQWNSSETLIGTWEIKEGIVYESEAEYNKDMKLIELNKVLSKLTLSEMELLKEFYTTNENQLK
jgi:hypothetical protein